MNQLSRPALERWRLVALLGPAALAAVVGFWSITVPSLWRDESVTVYFTDSSLGDALRDWGDQDAVHALYYLIARATAWIGPIEVGVRLPSVVAFALTALGIVLLGRRLSGQVAGTCAGVVYALIPVGSRYAQEARPYALVSAAAVFSTLALLRLSERLTKERFASYVLITTVLGYLNIYALLLLLAHGTYVLWEARAALRRVVPAWACSLVLLLPMILIGSSQSGQIGWIAKPGWEQLVQQFEFYGTTRGLNTVLVVAGVIGLGFIRGRSLLVSWALAPILVGFLVSQYLPMFIGRYLLFVLPAWCLLVGAGVVGAAQLLGRVAERWRSRARTPVVAMVVAVVVALVALLGLDEQRALRQPASHLDNLRALTHDLAQSADPGDALVLVWTSSLPFFGAYGGPFQTMQIFRFDSVPDHVERVWTTSFYAPGEKGEEIEFQGLSKEFRPVEVRRFGRSVLSSWERR